MFTAVHEGNIPVLIHVPHAGLHVDPGDYTMEAPFDRPARLRAEVEFMADLHVDALLRAIQARLADSGRSVFSASFLASRLSADVERFDDESEEMNAVGMGVVYTRSHRGEPLYSRLPDAEVERRKEALYRPHSRAMRETTQAIAERFGRCFIIDLHSYHARKPPYELHSGPRPRLCVGTEEAGDSLNTATLEAFCDYRPLLNTPFAGAYTPLGLPHPERVSSVMLEVRRDVYLSSGQVDLAKTERFTDAAMRLLDSILAG